MSTKYGDGARSPHSSKRKEPEVGVKTQWRLIMYTARDCLVYIQKKIIFTNIEQLSTNSRKDTQDIDFILRDICLGNY